MSRTTPSTRPATFPDSHGGRTAGRPFAADRPRAGAHRWHRHSDAAKVVGGLVRLGGS
jgi:hypothetical protein